MSIDSARGLSETLRAALLPFCDRLEVAGSIRRGKPDPKDIELVAVPRVVASVARDMFDVPFNLGNVSLLDGGLNKLLAAGEWALDRVLKRNGPKYKRLCHLNSGICCDLFITTLDSWGVIFTIRTGPGDFSKELVTRALRLGMKVSEGQLWRVHRDDSCTVVPVATEQDFFAALRLSYLEPHERTGQALRLAQREQ